MGADQDGATDGATGGATRRPVSYADAGVDLEAAEASVPLIAAAVARTHGPEVLGGVGGFGGLFALDTSAWRDPVLVSSTDGVGTKVELARRLGRVDTIGIDLVAMVVDDIVACGARPLVFNDYLSVGTLDPERVAAIVAGIAAGCEVAGCALVGGETAEHPGLVEADAFDLAGFGVGIVERDSLLGPARVRAGDVLVALPSSGLHANGFSLVRRIVEGLDLALAHGLERPLGDVLLEPTRIHAPDVLALTAELDVHAACHVTGGGLPGNLPRVLPDGLDVEVDTAGWTVPPVFSWLAERGPVEAGEMWRTFNMGVGMVVVVEPADLERALAILGDRGEDAHPLGRVVEGPGDPSAVVHRVRDIRGGPLGGRM